MHEDDVETNHHVDRNHAPIGYVWLHDEFINTAHILAIAPVNDTGTMLSFVGSDAVMGVDIPYTQVCRLVDSAVRKVNQIPSNRGEGVGNRPIPSSMPSHGGARVSTL